MDSLINIRKNSVGEWEPIEIIENWVIPDSCIIQLTEIPDNGATAGTTVPEIECDEYDSYGYDVDFEYIFSADLLGPGKFFVNHDTGEITFHESDIGRTIVITYWGLGSLIKAEHINELNDRIIIGDRSPTDDDTGYPLGTIWAFNNKIWVCLRSDPSLWVEWDGTKLSRRTTHGGEDCESYIDIKSTGEIYVFVNRPVNSIDPVEGLAIRINCNGVVYLPKAVITTVEDEE